MSTWYILRHAERELGDFYNPLLRHQDNPITPKGRADSQALCGYLVDKSIAAIYVSAYRRTMDTIDPVARQLGLSPVIDERLNEFDNGVLDGMPDAEVQAHYPEVWQAFTAREGDFRFPGGETGEEVQARIASFFAEKLAQHPSDNILLVAHDGWIRTLMCYLLGLPVWERGSFRVDFCGLVEITYQPRYGRWKLVRFNQVFA